MSQDTQHTPNQFLGVPLADAPGGPSANRAPVPDAMRSTANCEVGCIGYCLCAPCACCGKYGKWLTTNELKNGTVEHICPVCEEEELDGIDGGDVEWDEESE